MLLSKKSFSLLETEVFIAPIMVTMAAGDKSSILHAVAQQSMMLWSPAISILTPPFIFSMAEEEIVGGLSINI